MNKKIRSILLVIVLGVYNAVVFLAMNALLWRNHTWNPRKWTKINSSKNAAVESSGGESVVQCS